MESTSYDLDREDPTVYSDSEEPYPRYLREKWPQRAKPRKASRPATPATVTYPDSELKELAPSVGKVARLLKSKGTSI